MKLALPDMISNSYFPAMAAVELGFFANEGIDVTLELLSPADKAYSALADGEVDFVGAEAHAALSVFPEWRGLKLLCALAQGMYWFLVMRADIGAKRGDLTCARARRIAAAPFVELGLRRLLIDAGIDPVRDEVAIAPIPGSLGLKVNTGVIAAQALADGVVDGFWANGMGAEVAVRRGAGIVVLDVRRGDGPKSGFDYTFAALAATDRLIEKRRDIVASAKRAISAAHVALKQDVMLSAKIARKLFTDEQAKLITELVRRDLPFYDSSISEHSLACLNRFARDVGLLEGNPTLQDVVAAHY
jgi:ABC-type nitrate/sulfonate/bicarbonate transport system substrate-binding protein